MKNISKRKYKILCVAAAGLALIAVSFLYGTLAALHQHPPYKFVQWAYMRFAKTAHYEEINSNLAKIDPKQFVSISSKADILSKRRELIRFIWGSDALPDTLPSRVEENVKSEKIQESSAERVDKIIITMEYGFESAAYIFYPSQSNKNNKLVIYHKGHGEHWGGLEYVNFFVERGFTVMYFAMPLSEENTAPSMFVRPLGQVEFRTHNDLAYLRSEEFNPIKLFLEPVNAGLNYMKKFGYEEIYMVGLSGGGWTTALYSAIDPRILRSYPVAGSLPIYLRDKSEYGDWEQTFPELYSLATYLELYIMGAFGEGRGQTQVLNQYDSCCFFGVNYRLYENTVRNIVESLGAGKFSVFLDSSHRDHIISKSALEIILEDISK